MGDKTRRVTVQCPRCHRNVTVQAMAASSQQWCARCLTGFRVWVDAAGNATRVEAL